jgi:hypothetical protein
MFSSGSPFFSMSVSMAMFGTLEEEEKREEKRRNLGIVRDRGNISPHTGG